MEDYGFQPAEPLAPRRFGSRWLLVGGVALVLALTLGVGAFLGVAFGGGQAQAANSANQSANAAPYSAHQPQYGLAGTPSPGGQGQCATLTVSSVSGNTITAKASDGSTVTIHTTSSTTYQKNHQAADASAVTAGAKISVKGTTNSDGSITATSIDILG